MKLRSKFTILLSVVITVTITIATTTIYWIARIQLEKNAANRLQQTAFLVSTQIEERFDALLKNIDVWAQTPMIQNAALDPKNGALIHQVNHIFADIVQSDPIFQTFNLYDTRAALIASSIPERIGMQIAQDVVRKRDDFLAALNGKSVIKGPFMALSSAQPIVSLSVPVVRDGRVIGVLRPIVTIADFNESLLKPLAKGQEGQIFIFAPGLDAGDKLTPLDYTLVIKTPYIAPGIPSLPEMQKKKNGVVEYSSKGQQRYAAFQWMQRPHALMVVELPLNEVLAPIRSIKYSAFAVALITLLAIGFPAGMAIRPLLSNLRKCLEFVRTIQDGHMEERITVKSHDDVGELAHGLNEMAQRLERQHTELKNSELKYRSIFITAVEGIYQTTEDGRFLAANPALAKILGVDSPDKLLTLKADDFYAEPNQRIAIMDVLREHHEVSSYEFDLKRLDGEIRRCLVHSRAQMGENGRIELIQGILHDVTDERLAEAERKKAEKAEQLAIEARFKALRFQVNPHFLFNVLNTIDVLSRKTPERVPDLLQELSSYLRYTLKPNARMVAALHEELQSIKSYLAIEQIRFKDYLDVKFDVSPDAMEVNLPDMLLQPLVENAIKYGMRTSSMPLHIIIGAKVIEKCLAVFVNNTGYWIAEKDSHPNRPGIGLANLRERLEIFYGNQYSFEVSKIDGWINVEINLPLEPSFTKPFLS